MIIFFIIPGACLAREYNERAYQARWCENAGGVAEAVLPDRTRVDCLTDTHAVEVDFAPKWAEAIGQALYYSSMTGRSPGILLIMEREGDRRFLDRVLRVSGELGIDVWTTTPLDLVNNNGLSPN
ncbi:MAG: hypothetical protein A2V21_304005 [Deltaproteobacteria bacterium GWC2_55_46]|nr:MAG: hypothetical protein A2V21_304005 [Deltaproteobacteria bacterium GWC2_55_46]